MRLRALLAPVLLVVAGAGYFFYRPKAAASFVETGPESLAQVPERAAGPVPGIPWHSSHDRFTDAADTAFVRKSLAQKDLSRAELDALYLAAGRRYIRRKLAYA